MRTAVAVVIGCALLLVIFLASRTTGIRPSHGSTRVDFADTLEHPELLPARDRPVRPPLRIAAAAMVSPAHTRHLYDDLLRAIADRLDRRPVLAQKKTYSETNAMVRRREVDVAFVCSAPYVAGKAEFGMELLVVPVAHGRTVYYSYIIAHHDSEIGSLADMRGKLFAFTDPESNSGCLVPRHMLATRGETPESFFSSVQYTYAHDNSIRAVAEGVADGAAVDSLIWDFLAATDPVYTSKTKIVAKSPPYGIPPVVVHPDLDKDLKTQLKAIFLSLHQDEETRRILAGLKIDRFVEAEDDLYDSIREMKRMVKSPPKGNP